MNNLKEKLVEKMVAGAIVVDNKASLLSFSQPKQPKLLKK